MKGQWIGPYSGTNSGFAAADLEEESSGFVGDIFAYDNNAAVPRTFAFVELPKGQSHFSLRVNLQHMERGTGLLVTKENIAQRYPGVDVPATADTDWVITSENITVNWRTDVGTNGTAVMAKGKAQNPSDLVPISNVQSWADFKSFALSLEPWRFAFRGHANNSWRLRTSFHRTGRAALMKFMAQDVPALHRHLSGLTAHRFNLNDPIDYAAFLNLVQHHGYPTPILDWTNSPFVAAYFAFKNLHTSKIKPDQKVRILILDAKGWNAGHERANMLMPGYLHMTVLEPLAINNPRLVPQQSISTVTNVDDLESYVQRVEQREKMLYLRAIDLPAMDRRTVMHELGAMGITAGSLFPGLDGACQQLRERFFDF